jgi:hypothetical protein
MPFRVMLKYYPAPEIARSQSALKIDGFRLEAIGSNLENW